MAKWKMTYQVEIDPMTEKREEREVTIEAATKEEADLWAARNIVAPMVQEGNPYIPFIYGSGKIEEVK